MTEMQIKTNKTTNPAATTFRKTSVIVSSMKNNNSNNNNCNGLLMINGNDDSPNNHHGRKQIKVSTTRRRSTSSAYKELIHLISSLADKQLQDRLLRAFNNEKQLCSKCNQSITGESQSSATRAIGIQTEDVSFTDIKPQILTYSVTNGRSVCREAPSENSNLSHTPQEELKSATTTTMSEDTSPVPQKRRRKRKVCLPQVLKKSTAQILLEQQKPKMENKQKKQQQSNQMANGGSGGSSSLEGNSLESGESNSKRPRCDSISSSTANIIMSLVETADLDALRQEPYSKTDFIIHTMACEYLDSEVPQDGMFPIHNAIERNDLKALQRQIFVWKNIKKRDLNELLTNADEDCLQLAIVNRCDNVIIKSLLDAGLDTQCCIDEMSNTVMHMALLNDISSQSLCLLLEHIDLSILLKFNDDGYTPLQLAVRLNAFELAEAMLNALDKRLFGQSTFTRNEVAKDAEKSKKHRSTVGGNDTAAISRFQEFYEEKCEELEKWTFLKANDKYSLKEIRLKRQIMDICERKSGNTSLFHAIENKMEHFIYFLLAHHINPGVINHSGQDARSFFSENAKLLNLTLKIDKTMDKVVNLLEMY